MLQILGVPFSVHTRKVIWAARRKDLPYEIVPVIPLKPPPGWTKVSPLGKIPVLRTGTTDIVDSSVICQCRGPIARSSSSRRWRNISTRR